jgi:hypothetical protein
MLRLPWSGSAAEVGGCMFSGGEEGCWCIVRIIKIYITGQLQVDKQKDVIAHRTPRLGEAGGIYVI